MRQENFWNFIGLIGSVLFMVYLVGCAGFLVLMPLADDTSTADMWGIRILVFSSFFGAVCYGFIARGQYKKLHS